MTLQYELQYSMPVVFMQKQEEEQWMSTGPNWQSTLYHQAVEADHSVPNTDFGHDISHPESIEMNRETESPIEPESTPFEPPAAEAHNRHDQQKSSLPSIVTAYKRRYQHLQDSRFQHSSRIMELQYQWVNCQQSLAYLQSSLQTALQKGPTGETTSSAKKPKKRTKKSRAQVQSDAEIMADRMKIVSTLIDDMILHSKDVSKAEEALDNSSRAMFTALHGDQVADTDELWTEVSLKSSSAYNSVVSVDSVPQVATSLEVYYDAVGDFKIMRERLSDLIMERHEQWERRVLMADQEQVIEQSDEDFSREWRETLEVAERNLQDAGDALHSAQQACVSEGVAIPDWARVPPSNVATDQTYGDSVPVEGAVSPANSNSLESEHMRLLFPALRATSIKSGRPLQPSISPMHTPLPDSLRTRERVFRWIHEVADANNTVASRKPTDKHILEDFESWSSVYHLATLPRRIRSLNDLQSYSRPRVKKKGSSSWPPVSVFSPEGLPELEEHSLKVVDERESLFHPGKDHGGLSFSTREFPSLIDRIHDTSYVEPRHDSELTGQLEL